MPLPVQVGQEVREPDPSAGQRGQRVDPIGAFVARLEVDSLDMVGHTATLGPVTEDRRHVVGAAILEGGRVLAARRTTPEAAAGRWEFPGGKVEVGETPADALVREITEELGCTVEVTGWLDGAVPIGDTHLLTVALARLVAGDPVPHEHDQVRWLAAERAGRRRLARSRPPLPRRAPGTAGPQAIVRREKHARSPPERAFHGGLSRMGP